MFILSLLLDLPWYAPPRVLATLVMGKDALADILHFDALSFAMGTLVLLALSALLGFLSIIVIRTDFIIRSLLSGIFYGLSAWARLQYFIFTLVGPLRAEKSFMPIWYAVLFGIFGLVLGLITPFLARRCSI